MDGKLTNTEVRIFSQTIMESETSGRIILDVILSILTYWLFATPALDTVVSNTVSVAVEGSAAFIVNVVLLIAAFIFALVVIPKVSVKNE